MLPNHSQVEHQEILDSKTHLLVTGGPGSGKTTVAVKKALYQIEKGLQTGQRVLFLSFSRAAVARITETSKSELSKESQGLLSIQTFHSFFLEILKAYGYLLGAPKPLKLLLPHDEKILSGGLTDIHTDWPEWLQERDRLFSKEGKIVFDQFAPKTVELLNRSSLIKSLLGDRYPLIIVDEAQDTGPHAWKCIEILASCSQIMCLADLEQQIFDHLPGIDPERIHSIKNTLSPLEVDLGSVNNRSPGTDISVFANDILTETVRETSYVGVSRIRYNPKGDFSKQIRMALGRIYKTIKNTKNTWPQSVAILSPSGASIFRISASLRSGKPVNHKIIFDEGDAVLSTRLAAFLLEKKRADATNFETAQCLEILGDIKRAKGTITGSRESESFMKWATQIRAGKIPKCNIVKAILSLLENVKKFYFTGDPQRDWIQIKKLLRESDQPDLVRISSQLDYLISFKRANRFFSRLSTIWIKDQEYTQARAALDLTLVEDQLLGGMDDLSGLHLMTIHKSKGKQFDGVIIVREGKRIVDSVWKSSFVWRDDAPPYPRSRKILRVAISRARSHVLILDPLYPECPIISPYTL